MNQVLMNMNQVLMNMNQVLIHDQLIRLIFKSGYIERVEER